MRIKTLNLLLAISLLGSGGVIADPRVYTRAELDALLQTDNVLQSRKQWTERARREGSKSLLKTLATQLPTSPLDEYLLYKAVLDLDSAKPSSATVETVTQLAGRESRVFVWLEEGGHAKHAVPAFDVGGAARFKLAQWAETATALKTAAALKQGRFSLQDFAAMTLDQRRGVRKAMAGASVADLAIAIPELEKALRAGQPVGEMAADVALRRADKALLSLALRLDRTGKLYRHLDKIDTHFSPGESFQLLETAANQAALQSSALLKMASLGGSMKSAARDFLFARLTNKHTAGLAAAALARMRDYSVTRDLGKLLHDGNDVERRAAALALRFTKSDAANFELRRFLASPGIDESLQKDVARWFEN